MPPFHPLTETVSKSQAAEFYCQSGECEAGCRHRFGTLIHRLTGDPQRELNRRSAACDYRFRFIASEIHLLQHPDRPAIHRQHRVIPFTIAATFYVIIFSHNSIFDKTVFLYLPAMSINRSMKATVSSDSNLRFSCRGVASPISCTSLRCSKRFRYSFNGF